MLEREIPKIPIPAQLGEGPLYQPELKRKKTFTNSKKGPWKGNKGGGGRR